MAKSKYTRPIAEVSYSSQDANWVEFGIPKCCVYVGQAQGGISTDGKPLVSDGFAKCESLVAKNNQTLETALFHIQEWNLSHEQTPFVGQLVKNYIASLDLDKTEKYVLPALVAAASRYWSRKGFTDTREYRESEREAFKARMAELNRDRILKACFIRGNISLDRKNIIIGELLSYLGINDADEILVNTGQIHWGMAYKPKESVVLVDVKKQKKVLSFSF